jgi:hypothetical protein
MDTKTNMRTTRADYQHDEGPFKGISSGDVLQVNYDGAQAALMQVTRVKHHAIVGTEGAIKCKITMVSPVDLRFYADLTPNRQTCLRPISIRKMEGAN